MNKQTHEVFYPTTLSSKRNLMYIVICTWLGRFEDEAFKEGAPVWHMGNVYLFHLLLYTLGLPYLHPVKLTPPSGPGVVRAPHHVMVQ